MLLQLLDIHGASRDHTLRLHLEQSILLLLEPDEPLLLWIHSGLPCGGARTLMHVAVHWHSLSGDYILLSRYR